MDKFIVNSTAAGPLGIPTGRKCLTIKSGQYTNRVAILYAASATTLAIVWADPPYADFSSPVNVVTDSADSPFDAYMNDNGDIYITYTIANSFHLGFVKLTYDAGNWIAGSPVTVYNTDENYYPNIRGLSSDYLWIAYTRLSGGSYYVSAKSSSDDGSSWGTVSSPGDTLTSGSTEAFAAMTEAGDHHYVFYSDGGAKVAYRRKLNAGIIWNSEVILASGSGYNKNLAVATDIDGKIGIAYASSAGLKFREYSGSAWSGEFTLDESVVSDPVVSYQGGAPYVLFASTYGTNMNLIMCTRKAETTFQSPVPLDPRKSYLQKLLVYDASAGTYQDRTGEAASPDSADILHTGSGSLISANGDAVFIGMNEPFHFLNLILSTAGSGGEVVWKYWDGQAWKAFAPTSGAWHFTTTQHDLLLWDDYQSITSDWQQKTISGNTLYWIAATVLSSFNVAPVGTQISAISNLKAISAQV